MTFVEGSPYEEGDFNTDGVIDSDDYIVLRSNQHADLTSLSLAEAYRSGDLTADLASNHADFAAFKAIFEGANGAGSFAAMVASLNAVPEPTSAGIVLSLAGAVLTLRRRCASAAH